MNEQSSPGTPARCAAALTALLGLFTASPLEAQTGYQKPPKEILDALKAPPTPQVSVSPDAEHALLMQGETAPGIAEVAQPMLRLAGLRINPATNGPHLPPRIQGLTLVRLPGGEHVPVKGLPEQANLNAALWSFDGKRFAFTHTTRTGIELWVGDAATAQARRLPGVTLNAVYGPTVQWLQDGKTLLCLVVPVARGPAPAVPMVPTGPTIQESYGKVSPAWTYQDLLRNAHDAALFDYYATAQLARVDTATGRRTAVGKPAIFGTVTPSPDGKLLLVSRVVRPYSYLLPVTSFAREIEVWDQNSKKVHTVASLPLADQVPIEGVPTGPRQVHWRPTAPATLIWAEALDGGDPKKKVAHRDRLLALAAPFTGKPTAWHKTVQRFLGVTWGEPDLALIQDYDRNKRWSRTVLVNADNPAKKPREVWSLSNQDRYKHPGAPVLRTLPNGHRILQQHNGNIFLIGQGASPRGDLPFLDRMNLTTLKTERYSAARRKPTRRCWPCWRRTAPEC